MLRIDEILGTEAATDIGCDKAHRLRLDAERPRREVAGRVDTLGRDVRGVAAGRSVKDADDAARFHWIGDDAVIIEPHHHDMRRGGKRGFGRHRVAVPPFETAIAGRLFRQ